ncbi:MAG: hypothetical protein EZS28_049209 [Streblomastix strix]|uniref:Uncharacterized protein n=1 Tax=Streblomastix strix TaxID=222440 RepID=A0A5J4TA67_9EUKA|nr:MAG: hypothetical protein EZS28_049209 [Streblomastix strix]
MQQRATITNPIMQRTAAMRRKLKCLVIRLFMSPPFSRVILNKQDLFPVTIALLIQPFSKNRYAPPNRNSSKVVVNELRNDIRRQCALMFIQQQQNDENTVPNRP